MDHIVLNNASRYQVEFFKKLLEDVTDWYLETWFSPHALGIMYNERIEITDFAMCRIIQKVDLIHLIEDSYKSMMEEYDSCLQQAFKTLPILQQLGNKKEVMQEPICKMYCELEKVLLEWCQKWILVRFGLGPGKRFEEGELFEVLSQSFNDLVDKLEHWWWAFCHRLINESNENLNKIESETCLAIYNSKKSIENVMSWVTILENQFSKPYYGELVTLLKKLRNENPGKIYPHERDVFAWMRYCKPEEVKVVILGQDPYPQPGVAHGLAFSMKKDVSVPSNSSLGNIFKVLKKDLKKQFTKPDHGDLSGWARQGVLLLNVWLTISDSEANISNEEKKKMEKCWELFTGAVISYFHYLGRPSNTSSLEEMGLKLGSDEDDSSDEENNLRGKTSTSAYFYNCDDFQSHDRGVVFMLWGQKAQRIVSLIDKKHHAILVASHPSSKSWKVKTNPFYGCEHFSVANKLLSFSRRTEINWSDL